MRVVEQRTFLSVACDDEAEGSRRRAARRAASAPPSAQRRGGLGPGKCAYEHDGTSWQKVVAEEDSSSLHFSDSGRDNRQGEKCVWMLDRDRASLKELGRHPAHARADRGSTASNGSATVVTDRAVNGHEKPAGGQAGQIVHREAVSAMILFIQAAPRLRLGGPAGPALPPAAQDECNPLSGRTTTMMRNLPSDYTRTMLVDLLDREGFAGAYDFVYLPTDLSAGASLGFAFVNLVSQADAERVRRHFDGFQQWGSAGAKPCSVGWSGSRQQGLAANIQRYRNSSVMHPSVPDESRPALFQHGVRVAFPSSTRRPWPPHESSDAPAGRH